MLSTSFITFRSYRLWGVKHTQTLTEMISNAGKTGGKPRVEIREVWKLQSKKKRKKYRNISVELALFLTGRYIVHTYTLYLHIYREIIIKILFTGGLYLQRIVLSILVLVDSFYMDIE